jgi:hypothetical protein
MLIQILLFKPHHQFQAAVLLYKSIMSKMAFTIFL